MDDLDGRNHFEKGRGSSAYHIEMDALHSNDDIETTLYGIEIVSAPACTGHKGIIVAGWNRLGRQHYKLLGWLTHGNTHITSMAVMMLK